MSDPDAAPMFAQTVQGVEHDGIVTPAVTKPSYMTAEMQAETDTISTLKRLCITLADTEWGTPFGNKPERMLAAVLQGRALDVDAMTSLREISVIGGKPFLSAELRLALVRRAGHQVTGDAYPDKATVLGKRHDTGEEVTVTYTLAEAVAEGVVQVDADGKPRARSSSGKALPWERYTQSMLWAGAVRRLCDRLFSECLTGRAL